MAEPVILKLLEAKQLLQQIEKLDRVEFNNLVALVEINKPERLKEMKLEAFDAGNMAAVDFFKIAIKYQGYLKEQRKVRNGAQ